MEFSIKFDTAKSGWSIVYIEGPQVIILKNYMRCDMRFPTMWYVRPAKAQISLRARAVWSEPCQSLEYFMNVKLLTEHHLEFLSLKGSCTGSSES